MSVANELKSPTGSRPVGLFIGGPGAIDGARGLQITRAYLAAFFGQYLGGSHSALLDGPAAQYPEVSFESR